MTSMTKQHTEFSVLPGVGKPAARAFAEAGYAHLEALDGADYAALLALHGVGKRGLERVQAALVERGLSLSGDVPASEDRSGTWTVGNTGQSAADIKTQAGDERDLEEYLASLSARRYDHAQILLDVFGRATGEEPVLWGPSMIGYGEAHYVNATGREGDTFRVGFSPRTAKLSLYGIQSSSQWDKLSAVLGKHASSVSCVYVNKPEDIDLDVLEELIRAAWEEGPGGCA